jgi:phosphoglycerate dehydrogenase-like enzyme
VVCNVEGNFSPNVDHAACFARGIHVLGCGPAYAQAVAEHALGLALDLARGTSREDRAFRSGTEHYVAEGNEGSVLLRGATVGLLGYGNLGRALHRLLVPFDAHLRVHDPWLPDAVLREAGLHPAPLAETVRESTFLFVLATVTAESERLLGARELDLVPPGGRLVLVSRAAVCDFAALLERLRAGRFLAAVDVWPEEPLPPDSPFRELDGLVLSGHRAGGIPQAFAMIGDMVLDDLRQVERGLPPARMQVAAPELVGRYRNRPVG